MTDAVSLRAAILGAWATSARTTSFLIERIPDTVWSSPLPGLPSKTIAMACGHVHNARCRWLKTLAQPLGLKAPPLVDRRRVKRRALVRELKKSDRGMRDLLSYGLDHGGAIPPTRVYVWRNLPLDVGHVLAYFVAHEAHHRGQIIMAARQLGLRLPAAVTNGVWEWTRRSKEAREPRAAARS